MLNLQHIYKDGLNEVLTSRGGIRKGLLVTTVVLLLYPTISWGQKNCRWTMAFWNVENYFDIWRDTVKEDSIFTPQGENHWTKQRYQDKKNKIYKIIAALQWPAIVGMAEVENDYVLLDLCQSTPLRKKGYDFVHFESPDKRGIDCALLYQRDMFELLEKRSIYVSDTSNGFYTRDILMAGGVLTSSVGESDTCYVLVNHWPSKRGGAIADSYRISIAKRLTCIMDSLHQQHPTALIIAMGDFNASPEEEAIRDGMGFDSEYRNKEGFYNLMYQIPKGRGSYKYKDSWSCIDQLIANRKLKIEIFAPSFMLQDDNRYLGKKPYRTYTAMKYHGGYSDHLPIIVEIP